MWSLLAAAPVMADTAAGAAAPVPAWQLETIVVEANAEAESPSTDVRSASQISRDNVLDARDLVRHIPGITVSEGGRAGTNGFAIRGVDGNRVAVTVDGVAQAEYFLPEVYLGYGYLNGNRNSVELEHMKQVTLHKGADSYSSGSGGIGGSVQFVTKDINDFVDPGKTAGVYSKLAYASRSRQWLGVAGAGTRLGDLGTSFFLQYTRRGGHEIMHHGGGADIAGRSRGRPDPVDATTQAWLSKLDVCVVRGHCVQLSHDERAERRFTDEKSYGAFGQTRQAWDSSPYRRQALVYRWIPSDGPLESLSAGLHLQNVLQRALTENRDIKDGFLDQRYDRRTTQRDRQWRLEAAARVWDTSWGRHRFSGELAWTQRRLNNDNTDRLFFKNSAGGQSSYSIVDPVRVRSLSLKLKDSFAFGPLWHGELGWRVDRYAHQPTPGVAPSYGLDAVGRRRFSAGSWFGNLSHEVTSHLRLSYAVSQGFRAPSAQELYFRFRRGFNYFLPNPGLKAERALNQELTLTAHGDVGNLAVALFQTRYRDFIEERHTTREVPNPFYEPFNPWGIPPVQIEDYFQQQNIDRAKVWGVELKGLLDAHTAFGAPKGWGMDVRATLTRGRTSLGDGLRALQPLQVVAGLFYEAASWGLRADLVHHGAKRERDTLRTTYGARGAVREPSKYLSQAVYLVDLSAYTRLGRHMTLSAGIYNLFDRKYFRWDTLRSLASFGTTGRIDPAGEGLNRYTAPGRNVAVNLEIRY
ncbi:TonB-dependent hemoglobin/transferrin/lactoferrin family receptor [Bordetella holmesii]|nr:transferrin/hemoglobin-binding protein [Bordetella holmesii H558]AOB37069.1 transferrin/hemoglobin-binding protein [Bordetella holmesii]AUL21343.1 transferrin/hemoglobin-binding protein [Bordetella holmesii]AUL24357.1 transferrin/hemoglobin-binding protein [Bordetella holmesii]AUL28006.1 transferrin/hemoglobin-binding protein [Bordetella holmesii]